jgi:hypothetical protein
MKFNKTETFSRTITEELPDVFEKTYEKYSLLEYNDVGYSDNTSDFMIKDMHDLEPEFETAINKNFMNMLIDEEEV